MRSLNLMRTLSEQHWGADQVMRVYRMIIRPKIDYGSAGYGAANKTLWNN